MEKDHLSSVVVIIAAYFLVICCDDVSSSVATPMGYTNDPFQEQCTWLFRANPDDCRSYFQCLHGRPVLRRCPRKLHWNSDGHYCGYEARSTCKAGKRKSDVIPSTSDNSVLEVYDNTKALLKRRVKVPCPANTFKPYPGDCSKFIQCGGNNDPHTVDCPAGLHWDASTKICNWPEIAKCNATASAGTSGGSISYESTTMAPFPFTSTTSAPPTQASTTSLPPFITTELTTTTSTTAYTTTERPTTSSPTKYPILQPNSEYKEHKVICYFTNWAIYRQEEGRYTPADIDPSKCTHIIYAFACLNPVTYKLEMCDPWIDGKEGKNFYGQITALRKFGVKVMIAVGGWNDSAYSKWTLMLKDLAKMETFIKSVCDFLLTYDFDGLDLDYEYPTCPQANCNFDSKFEKQAFVTLVKGLRLMCGPQTILSAAVSCNENIIKEAYDVPTLSKYLDFINMMAYDFHGAWEKTTGINSPLEPYSNEEPHLNVRHAVSVFLTLGAPADKLCLGIPMYGQSYALTNPMGGSEIGVKSSGPGRAGPATKQKGMMSYYEICNHTWTKTVQDEKNRVGPYKYDMNDGTWVSHDDPRHIRRKCDFIKNLGLGGAMIWALDLDDFRDTCKQGRYPLLTAINENLRGTSYAEPSTESRKGASSRKSSRSNKRSNRSSNRSTSSKRQRKGHRRN